MKKRLLAMVFAAFITMSVVGCGNSSTQTDNSAQKEQTTEDSSIETDSSEESASKTADTAQENTVAEPSSSEGNSSETTTEPAQQAIASGSHTLPSGVELSYDTSVRNDVTGRWRLSMTSTSTPTDDYAYEYYQNMISGDEVHFVVNFTLNTTTCIKCMDGILFVDTYEYVNGEEHDAKIMPSGTHLTSQMYTAETGEPF